MWLAVAIQSPPFRSSAIPKTGSRSESGLFFGTRIFPARSNARPLAVPIHKTCIESISRQLTSGELKPSWREYVRQLPFDSSLTPFGVPNHIVPSSDSAMEETVSDARPFAEVYVLNRPSRRALTPPLRVPAQMVPFRLR